MSTVTQAWLRARPRPRQTHLYPPGPSASCPACCPPVVHTGTPEDPGTQTLSTSLPSPTTHTVEVLWQNILLLPSPWWTTGGYEGWNWVFHSIF